MTRSRLCPPPCRFALSLSGIMPGSDQESPSKTPQREPITPTFKRETTPFPLDANEPCLEPRRTRDTQGVIKVDNMSIIFTYALQTGHSLGYLTNVTWPSIYSTLPPPGMWLK